MIGSAFLKRLMFQLDFLGEEDKQTVLEFYRKKLSAASTLTEEEAIVKTFGSPEHIASKLKETYQRYLESQKSMPSQEEPADSLPSEENVAETKDLAPVDEENVSEEIPAAEEAPQEEIPDEEEKEEELPAQVEDDLSTPEEISDSDEEGLQEDVIFSKPPSEEKAPEVIHSLEGGESVPLYGEKVVIEERQTPIEEIPLEPIDSENGLTPEEIELAKAKTLEKAEHFDSENPDLDQDEPSQEEKEDEPSEESDVAAAPEREKPLLDDGETERQKGIFDRMFPSASPSTLVFLKVLFSVILLPAILLVFGGIVLLYSVTTLAVVLFGIVLFALMVALIICGVVELIYGFSMLFDTVSVALIELGLGTILFAIVTALGALIYEFLFGILPKALKKLTGWFKKVLKKISLYLYGGKA